MAADCDLGVPELAMLEYPLYGRSSSILQDLRIRLDRLIRTDWSVRLPKGRIIFSCPNRSTKKRVSTLFSKEPATLEWIEEMGAEDVFWDIGANIGVYSLYAAIEKSLRVYAFEPAASNYHVLVRNVSLNRIEEKVSPLCIAFHNATRLGVLRSKSLRPGSSRHSFGSQPGLSPKPSEQSAMATLGIKIDDFVRLFAPQAPNHIKIDVDGNERLILEGASQTLLQPSLRSMLVEIDLAAPSEADFVFNQLGSAGFFVHSRARTNLSPLATGCTTYNYVFKRSPPAV
jgi:FkbM family methyltransferase